jgi:3-hydroxyisobutyrate dehydrogenase-like beta-hydroxyacid dehydrogenase
LGDGHRVTIYDPDARASGRMAAAGARVADDLRGLAGSCEVVISMLPDDSVLRDAVLSTNGLASAMRPGSIHMISGTHGVGAVGEVTAAHRNAGQVTVACHVLGRPDLAAAGKLGLVPGGPPAALATLRPVFAALGDRVFEAGADPLSATAIKIANNLVLGCAIEAIGEGMALVRHYDVDPQVFHEVLVGGLFNCTAYAAYGDLIAKQDWNRVGATAAIGLKDADLALEAAGTVNAPLPAVAVWRSHLLAAISRGEGELDWSVMAREQFRASGLE